MKKTSILTLLLTFYLVFLLASTSLRANAASLSVAVSSLPSSVDVQVEHFIEIRNGGLVLINDTIRLSTKPGENASFIDHFLIGFPFEYAKVGLKERFYPDYVFALDSQGMRLKVLLDVGLLGRLGFYGVEVLLNRTVSISQPYSFTVVFVFSNLLRGFTTTASNLVQWNLTFPLYPSLTQDASSSIVKIFLPDEATYPAQYSSLYLAEGKDFNVDSSGSRQVLNLTQNPLTSFTHEPGWLIFTQLKTAGNIFQVFEANEMKKEITLDEWGRIFCSESYTLTNKGPMDITLLRIRVPQDAYGVSAVGKDGGRLSVNATVPANATISFPTTKPLQKDVKSTFVLTYWLPWGNHVNQYSLRYYNLSLTFFERQKFDWIIRKLTTTVTLPEGAEFIRLPTLQEDLNSEGYSSLQRNVFQETLTFNFYNVTPFNDLNFSLSYGYLVFWSSFRPTLWMGTIVAIVCAVVFLWRLPKRPEVGITPVPSKDLRSFVDAYEKKTSTLSELLSMEEQLAKGKIPRRKYKVRRETLEGRLSMLSRGLAELKEKLRRSGTRYASFVGQIEVTETELEGLETDIRRVEGRYKRGEISKGAYLRLLEEYHRRRERARVTIDGVLLRLKEEIT